MIRIFNIVYMISITKSMKKEDNRTQKIGLLQFFQGELDELDMFLQEFQKIKPDWLDTTLTEYFKILTSKINPTQTSKGFPISELSQDKWKLLGAHLPKIQIIQQALLSFLHLENFSLAGKEFLDRDDFLVVPFGDYIRCAYYHVYYFFHALMNLQGKEMAYAITRQIAEINYTKPRPDQKKMNSVREFGEWIDGLCTRTHNFISGEDDDQHFINKVVGCVWGEALQQVEDPELMYFLICYGDFFTPKAKNEHFELTRKETILQGSKMCDFCYHDTRIHQKLEHPIKEFWEKLC
ncbi:hypothetical protein NEF87_003689 [Candidatus Lokiarchaeum ossiferum]|uniref:L-2-amino-thiazoline-4-carboxylic acid hydrolase n=1 Tax=Candidatus Lokiarchaeum ossiferum TaxID=2951803 RepID=A0ABY6HXX4_9ARCH|nr:hypothetical protein NEF87_003689 [Candidatus Lokiarchaeum sp. B-35]